MAGSGLYCKAFWRRWRKVFFLWDALAAEGEGVLFTVGLLFFNLI
jgi:hypothetical protein